MLRLFVTLMLCVMSVQFIFADDCRQADHYVKEAEYYQKKADGYRREAQYYLKRAEGYQKEAAYCTRKGKTDRAKDYQHKASRAMDDYKVQMRHAANADDKAADYLRRASNLLRK
ncbi:MAG: hypothetical protein NC453_23575 [Muribaculum sp.]|nr:hypothetical protein [Muribaculum sp.]